MTTGPVLRDIHLPSEPGWWPPAPGWWIVAALAALAIAWLLRRQVAARRVRRARRALRAEFDRVRAEAPDAAAQVAAMSMLLRRVVKRHAPEALTLRDVDWLRFLDDGDEAQPFSEGAGRLLLDGPYRPRVEQSDADALASVVKNRLDGFVTVAGRRHSRESGTPGARSPVNG